MINIIYVPEAITELVAAGAITCGMLCGGVADDPELEHAPFIDEQYGKEAKQVESEKALSRKVIEQEDEYRELSNRMDALNEEIDDLSEETVDKELVIETLRKDVKRLESELSELRKKNKSVSSVKDNGSKTKPDDAKTKKVVPDEVTPVESTEEVSKGQMFEQVFVATAYTAGVESTGKAPGSAGYGVTASGATVSEGRTIACPPSLAFGTKVDIEGVGERVCEDRGGDIGEGRLDVYMSDLGAARAFGRKSVKVSVIK